jgi:zinc protease
MNPLTRCLPVIWRPILLILLSAPAWADDIQIPYTKVTLDNGLTLIVHEDHKAPIVAVNVWYHVGSKNEVPGRTGFAHLFEHLMFQGSENHDEDYISSLQKLGATDLNGTTWFDRTNYFETVPTNALDTVLWLESDRMGHFADSISQAKLDEQRGVVQNEKRQGDNQPYGKVWAPILEQVFPNGHPYSWETIGSMADLEAASLEDVREWFATYYGPNNAVIVIAGDVETDEVIAKVTDYFSDIPPGPPLTKPGTWIPRLDSERRRTMEDRVPQSRMYAAWPGPAWGTMDAHHLALAAEILGGDKNSRLYKRLVYEDQIASDVAVAPLPLEISGITYLIATAQPDHTLAEVEAAAKEEIRKFIQNGPTRKELERVKVRARADFLRGIERVGGTEGKSGILARSMVYGNSPDFYQQQLADIETTTREDLRQVIENWMGAGVFVMEVHPYPELTASESGADRTTAPDPGEFPDVGFPAFVRTQLDNGLDVIISERAGGSLVAMSLIIDAGYASDQFSRPGTAKIAMAMLDEGTSKLSALEISEDLALQGARLSAGSTLDTSFISLSAIKDRLDDSMSLFAKVALDPIFPADELERMRRISLTNIQQEKNTPTSMGLRVLPRFLYGENHPYGQPMTGSGTEESITATTRDDLVNFHETWFKPNHATLIVTGDVSAEDILPRLEKLFGKWEPGDVPEKGIATVRLPDDKTIYIIDKPDADQSVILAAQLLPPKANPDEIKIQAMNDILGGTFAARINMNLREDKHWSYGARTLIPGARGQRPLMAYAQVQTDKTRESIEELRKEITGIHGDRPPTQDELTVVKSTDTLSLPGRWESISDVLASIGEIVQFSLPDDYWSTYAQRVNSLDVEDVTLAAKQHITPDNYVWVVVGDRAVIESGIRELGFDSVRFIDADGHFVDQ